MIAYHFAYDLRFFRVIAADFENDLVWLSARAAIVTTFLLLVGVSLALASRADWSWPAFGRRLALIAACALAASAASAVVEPQRFIYFGILHCIAVSSVLALPFRSRPVAALGVGIAVIATGLLLGHPAFDPRAWSWIGFTTVKPPTQDFVPLFPWFGVVLLGVAIGHWLIRRAFAPVAPLARTPEFVRTLGRHSLLVYMIHQPIMMGLLWLAVR
jgi:uncharacterized membrane protein